MTPYLMGQQLRSIREDLRLTLKEVEKRSREIARFRQNPEYIFTAGRLSQVENSNSLPSLYKLATLSEVYSVPYAELLQLYGIAIEASGVPGNGNGRGNGHDSVAPAHHDYA